MRELLAFALALTLTGCSVAYGELSLSLFKFDPSDEIQIGTETLIGLRTRPAGIQGPALDIGYMRTQHDRIPAFDESALIPDITVTTRVEGGGSIVEELAVGTLSDDPESAIGSLLSR